MNIFSLVSSIINREKYAFSLRSDRDSLIRLAYLINNIKKEKSELVDYSVKFSENSHQSEPEKSHSPS